MKFAYKFSNLLGTIYRTGNLSFTPDGNSIISPVGNRLTIFDLKNNKANTLSLQSRYNYTTAALSPNGTLLIAVNDKGEAQIISLISCSVIHTHKFQHEIQIIKFSPDGTKFAVCIRNIILVFRAPGEITGEYNPFVLERSFQGGFDDITSLDWSTDSRFLAVGSRDNTTKILGIGIMTNFRTYILSGHTEAIAGCFFEEGSLHVNTISKNGQLCIWECSLKLHDIKDKNFKIEEQQPSKKKTKTTDSGNESEDDVEEDKNAEKANNKNLFEENSALSKLEDPNEMKDEDIKKGHPFSYTKIKRHYLADEPRKENRTAYLTAVAYNKKTKIMVTAFSTGAFYLYELPEVNLIHSLSMSNYPVTTACFNPTGDWVALGSSALGQLLVWEWQSEQYIMKQQGHNTADMTCLSYSPDGQYIATGGNDSKVKLWNVSNGFCFVTFKEHSGGITDIVFSANKKFLVSSSLDGTVRAFDLTRYRNFRTFTASEPVQFSCVAIDQSGEFVAAGGQDNNFEIYLWSIKLGTIVDRLKGHTSPVTTIAFSPNITSTTLLSGSWDKTVRIWNCLESNSENESIDLMADVTTVCFKPNGEEVAVATLNGNIYVFDVKTAEQTSSIEGRVDLAGGRSEIDIITAKKNVQGKYFSSIAFSADGECLLAGGKSQFVCIYHVREGILLKKFEITENHSFDGMDEFLNRRNMTEFGNMALLEEREKLEGGQVAIKLPGAQKGDMASRSFKPEVSVAAVRFSPTGQSWASVCTEGLMIYSLDRGIVFDPFNLSIEVTPKTTKECLKRKDYSEALTMAIKLNENDLLQLVIESIPVSEVELIVNSISNEYAQRIMQQVTRLLNSTTHVEFYLKWANSLLTHHGNKDRVFQSQTLLGLHEAMSRKYESLHKICDFNKYTLKVLSRLSLVQKSSEEQPKSIEDDDEDMLLISSKNQFEVENSDLEDTDDDDQDSD